MLERSQGAGFALEPRHPFGIGGEFSRQDLEGDIPAQLGVGGPENLAHAAGADFFHDRVVSEGVPGLHEISRMEGISMRRESINSYQNSRETASPGNGLSRPASPLALNG